MRFQNKKLLIFSLTSCLPCRFSSHDWKELQDEGYPITIVDCEIEKELVRKFEVKKVPTFILLEENIPTKTLIGKEDKKTIRELFHETGHVSPS